MTSNRAVRGIPGKLLGRRFFEASPELVAPRLLGKLLVHRVRGGTRAKHLAGRIVEVEAYLGPHHATSDPAAHAHRGPTPRNQVLFGPAGHAYVYSIYGMYFCMNITCEPEGRAGCVLLRALEPVSDLRQMARNRGLAGGVSPAQLTSGPGRLCQALGLTRQEHNGIDLTHSCSALRILDDGMAVPEATLSVRIGIRHAADLPLRFTLPGHACVSGPRKFAPTRVSAL